MSVEALLGTEQVFEPELHAVRPHPGRPPRPTTWRLLAGSEGSWRRTATRLHRVQDAYSVRSAPGSPVPPVTRSPTPLGSPAGSSPRAVDNPVVLADGKVRSNGNFHGAPLGYVLDFLAIAAADLGWMARAAPDRLLDAPPPQRSAAVPRRGRRGRLPG